MIPILVPRRGDRGPRDQIWAWIERWWQEQELGPIVIGDVEARLFNRSGARNAAARAAGEWELAIFADADTWMMDPAPLQDAIELARESGKVVLPHSTYVGLTAGGTSRLLRGRRWEDQIKVTKANAPLGIIVVPRSAWDELGGFDERFRGWGGEDTGFLSAARTLIGVERITGTIIHLWHPIDAGKRSYIANRGGPLRSAYRDADGHPERMRALLQRDPGSTYHPGQEV